MWSACDWSADRPVLHHPGAQHRAQKLNTWSLTRSSTAAINFSCGIASKEAPTHCGIEDLAAALRVNVVAELLHACSHRGHFRCGGGGGRMTSVVVVTRRRHPLEGQSLRELGRMRRHGRLELLLVLPDGGR